MRRVCTICARGGSRGVPNKNLKTLGGRSLVEIAVDQARGCGLFETVGVSSDSDAILEAARAAGADQLVKRPDALASDIADKSGAILHAVRSVEAATGVAYDTMVDLDVTAPLRISEDIAGSIAVVEEEGYDNCFSVAPASRSPYFNMVRRDASGSARLVIQPDPPIVRRQDAPEVFDMNASIYVWRRDAFFPDAAIFKEKTGLFVMPRERSLDIDSPFDWRLMELLWPLRG